MKHSIGRHLKIFTLGRTNVVFRYLIDNTGLLVLGHWLGSIWYLPRKILLCPLAFFYGKGKSSPARRKKSFRFCAKNPLPSVNFFFSFDAFHFDTTMQPSIGRHFKIFLHEGQMSPLDNSSITYALGHWLGSICYLPKNTSFVSENFFL